MQRMYLFFLLNRTYLKRYYGYYRERKFRKIHKILFKKRKRRLYGQGYLHTMERMSGNMLYRSRLVSKLKHVKQLLVNNKVFVNGKFIKGYSKKFKPLDVIHFFDINDKYFYLHSYFGVILDKSSKFFIENNLFVFIVKYSRVFGYICLFIIRSRCSLYMGNCRVFGAVYTYLVQENVFFRKL